MCMIGFTEGCDISSWDCGGLADYYCCTIRDMDGCRDNALFLNFVSESYSDENMMLNT